MDDLVLTGAAGIIGLFLAGVVLLYAIFFVAGLIYAAFVSGEYGGAMSIVCAILIAGSLYMAAGFWLHTTDRI